MRPRQGMRYSGYAMNFNDRISAADYDRRLSAEGYPGGLVDYIERELDGCGSVIDVGAGTGFFAIPLAARGYTIDAVEPSMYMLEILQSKIDAATAPKIRLNNRTWEDWEGEKRDALICLHALYPMRDPRAAIEKMTRYADRRIILVRSDEGSRNLSGLLREMTGKIRDGEPFIELIRKALAGLDMPYYEEIVEQRRTSVFYDLDGEARYYCGHLGLKEDRLEWIRGIIERNTVRREGRFEFEGLYRDFMVTF